MLERDYQNKILKPRIKSVLPGCIIMKNDEQQMSGIPDLVIFYKNKYAMIECKRSAKASFRPNQEHYIQKFHEWGTLSIVSYPENLEWTIEQVTEYFNAN